jgi:hypothetical protein
MNKYLEKIAIFRKMPNIKALARKAPVVKPHLPDTNTDWKKPEGLDRKMKELNQAVYDKKFAMHANE